MIHYKIVTDEDGEEFERRVNDLLEKGWIPQKDTLKANVSTTSNAWKADAQTERAYAIILEKTP